MYADFRRRHHMGQRDDQVVGSQPPSPLRQAQGYGESRGYGVSQGYGGPGESEDQKETRILG
jgi:hypothetical protein